MSNTKEIVVSLSSDSKVLLERLVTALETKNKSVSLVKGLAIPGISLKPFQLVPPAVPKPKYKSASAARVTALLQKDTILRNMGATSKGCDLVALSSPSISKYYLKAWNRELNNNPHGPITLGLLRVLKSRQKELGVEFSTLNIETADKAVEALKKVGRRLLCIQRDTVDPLV